MSQLIKPESIGAYSISGTTFTLPASVLNIGGKQYETSTLTLALTGLSASTKYNIFAVQTADVVSLVKDTASTPTGYTASRLIYTFNTDSNSAIMSQNLWQTGKAYIAGDLVVREGYLIRCLVNHTSGTFATDVQSRNWQMASPMKNYLINGNFDFWQRNTTFSPPTGGVYTADRWYNSSGANTSAVISRQASSVVGSTYSFQWVAGSLSSSFNVAQPLESFLVNELKTKIITFSAVLACNSGSARTLGLYVQRNSSADTMSGGSWGTLSALTGITLSTTPTRYSVTLTVPNDGTANGLRFMFSETGGTTLATDTFIISQAMVNEGPVPASFQIAGTNIAGELAMCQRYYEKSYDQGTPPGTITNSVGGSALIKTAENTAPFVPIYARVQKRVGGTTTAYSNWSSTGGLIRNTSTNTDVSCTDYTGNTVVVTKQSASGVSAGNTLAGHWTWEAELT